MITCISIDLTNKDIGIIMSAARASHTETSPGIIISPMANIANKIPQYNIFPPLLPLDISTKGL